ncbi:MAG: FecCD family ABC transporter permease [Halothermotrichaceae bacterium]
MLPKSGIYSKVVNKRIYILLILFVMLLLGTFYSISLGVASISFGDVYGVILKKLFGIGSREYSSFVQGIVFNIRLPRVILAVIAGIALGTNGALMQSVLRNPLASPYTLGVSAGSAFGAGLTIVLGNIIFGKKIMTAYGSWIVIGGAFSTGLLTIFIINLIASLKKGGTAILILAGVALSYLFSAGLSFFKYIANHEQLTELTIWLMGGLYRASWIDILILTPILILGILFILKMAWDINTLNAGEEVAANLGVNVRNLRRKGSIIAAFVTSCVVAFTGIIGFIGLMAPHFCRMIIGNDNRFLILASGLAGGLILLGADTVARIIIDPAELPVGIITSICGAPFFLYMLLRRKGGYWQ